MAHLHKLHISPIMRKHSVSERCNYPRIFFIKVSFMLTAFTHIGKPWSFQEGLVCKAITSLKNVSLATFRLFAHTLVTSTFYSLLFHCSCLCFFKAFLRFLSWHRSLFFCTLKFQFYTTPCFSFALVQT